MKKVKVRFFGALSEAVGKQEEELELSGNLDDLLREIKQKYPSLKEIRFSAAINHEINGSTKELSDGDEVALLPPFTGG